MSEIRSLKIEPAGSDCYSQCVALYEAITALRSGRHKVQIRHGEYWVEYNRPTPSDIAALVGQYRELRQGCPKALSTLPSLAVGAQAVRGRGLPTRIYG